MTVRSARAAASRMAAWPARPSLAAWVAGVALYCVARAGRSRGLLAGPAADHLTDLLFIPLLLGLILALQRLRTGRRTVVLPRRQGWAVTLACAAWFEAILPHLDSRATADPWDAAAYLVGWGAFAWAFNRPRTR